jgi:ORF6N domain-containing protein
VAKKISQLIEIEETIHFIRGQKAMLDSDLARIYGVQLKRLNEQVRRNKERFPPDFAFQLDYQEVRDLKSQIATSSERPSHGGKRKLPWAFTEHGAIMLASVLNSPVAIEASVRVVRAFVHLREMLANNKALTAKFSELERRLDGHDEAVKTLFDAIRELLNTEPPPEQKREIGFHIHERSVRYRIRRRL